MDCKPTSVVVSFRYMEAEATKSNGAPRSKERRVFAARLAAWFAFACAAPVGFIAWRYDLFATVSKVNFGGWGLVAIAIIAAFALSVVKYVKQGLKGWSMTKQVLSGIAKVLVPLLALYFALAAIRDSLDAFLQALGVTIASEAVAIPLNPLPKWAYEKSRGETEDAIDVILNKRKK